MRTHKIKAGVTSKFFTQQLYSSLVECISNYVFKEEYQIDIGSNKTEAITEKSSIK